MAAATKCEIEQCAPARSPKPTAGDDAPPRPSRKTRRQEYWKKNGQQQKTRAQHTPGQTRVQSTAEEQLPGRLQIPLIKSDKATGGRSKHGKAGKPIRNQPGLQSDCGDWRGPVIPSPQLGEYNASMSRFFHQDQTIEVWRNASTHRIVEKGQQGPIQHVETQVSSIHVVDGIPVRVEKSSLYTRTESTCSQSIGYLSPIDTPATELSEWWPPNSGVLAFVGGQSEEPALSQPSLANDRSSATAAVDSEDKENAKDCPIIKITGVGDADSSELIGEKNRGGDISQKAFGQVDPDAPLLWDMSKAHLDWVKPKDLLTSISLGIQRAGTFPCVGKFHFEEDLIDSLARSHESA